MAYISFDLFCLILFAILLFNKSELNFHDSTDRALSAFLGLSACIILLDIAWAVIPAQVGNPAHAGWIINTSYFCISGFVGYSAILWLNSEQGDGIMSSLYKKLLVIPALLLAVLTLLSRRTGWIFYMDASGGYHRGPLYWMQIVLAFGPNVVYTLVLFRKAMREVHRTKRKRYLILATFPIPIYISQVLQIMVSEISMINCGLTVGAVWVYIRLQNQLISRDSLTGLSNRFQLDNHLFNLMTTLPTPRKGNYYLCMVDLDRFKQINDVFGHLEGDNALRIAADILKHGPRTVHPFLGRYGGDEFTIVMEAESLNAVCGYCDALRTMAEERSQSLPYQISFSIGIAQFQPNQTVQELIAAADAELYKEKQLKKKS